MIENRTINPIALAGSPAGNVPSFKPGTRYPRKAIVWHRERLWFALQETTSMPPREGHWRELKARLGW